MTSMNGISEQPLYTDGDTICALSTAAGTGAIAVVRVSGRDAFAIVDTIFCPAGDKTPLSRRAPNTLVYGEIVDEQGATLDQVVVSLFRAPHSFTGEDTVEISCHGSLYIRRTLIALLLKKGCRGAMAGEFTRRAFAHGKLDLSQAEAVADLIASESAASHRLAMNQMRGGFSRELSALREQLLQFVSLVELELDFSEEDVEFADRSRLTELAQHIEQVITRLADTFHRGNALKNGIPTIIVGETNAGKSTLLNRLLHDDRALVSDIHGTTRDTLEDTVDIQGTTFRFIDTAGIRDTRDTIENMGIDRTFRKLEQADIVLWTIDGTTADDALQQLSEQLLPRCAGKHLVALINKTDLLTPEQCARHRRALEKWGIAPDAILEISARTDADMTPLENHLAAWAQRDDSASDVVVTNQRHYEALLRAQTSIRRVLQGLRDNYTGDLLSQDIRETLHHLGEITGEITTDEILSTIFRHFCIGK